MPGTVWSRAGDDWNQLHYLSLGAGNLMNRHLIAICRYTLQYLRPLWFLVLGTNAVSWNRLIRIATPVLISWLALHSIHLISSKVDVAPIIILIVKLCAIFMILRVVSFLINIGSSSSRYM